MNEIEVSVIMSVYNEQDSLDRTMQSILDQEAVNLELIVVNDGSSDNTSEILNQYAANDDRITIIDQHNQGITQALINGCNQAKGEFIARQDAGDWSLSQRLKTQLDIFRVHPNVALCSTGSRYFSERGELLFEASLSSEEARRGLIADSLDSIKGPSHHGCTMFRRESYVRCGGYRADFVVAQDLDLWIRLANIGEHLALPSMYYEAVLRQNAISSTQRKSQEISRQHIFECAQLRRNQVDDTAHVGKLREKITALTSHKTDSALDYHYFVGSVLLKNNAKQSRYYFKEILKSNPMHLKGWVKLIRSYLW